MVSAAQAEHLGTLDIPQRQDALQAPTNYPILRQVDGLSRAALKAPETDVDSHKRPTALRPCTVELKQSSAAPNGIEAFARGVPEGKEACSRTQRAPGSCVARFH